MQQIQMEMKPTNGVWIPGFSWPPERPAKQQQIMMETPSTSSTEQVIQKKSMDQLETMLLKGYSLGDSDEDEPIVPKRFIGKDDLLNIKLDKVNQDLPRLVCFDRYPEVYFPFTPEWIMEEKRIIQAIVSKKGWEDKIMNPEIVKKWKNASHGIPELPKTNKRRFRTKMTHQPYGSKGDQGETSDVFSHVIDVLIDCVKNKNKIVEPIDAIVQVDRRVKDETKKALLKAIDEMEKRDKDWHPNSNNKVLDLVHPSLYCNVRHLTCSTKDKIVQRGVSMTKWIGLADKFLTSDTSSECSWIPTDIHVEKDGKVKILSHVNNVHPKKDKVLYGIFEDILTDFIPLFEASLTKVVQRQEIDQKVNKILGQESDDDDDDQEDQERIWDPKEAYKIASKEIKSSYTLKGRDLQVILKLSNTELNPDDLISKSFEGGNWHLEGMDERIIATGIYYYSFENIGKSELSFRQAVEGDTTTLDSHMGDVTGEGWGSEKCEQFELKTGFQSGDKLNQLLGSVTTLEDRCIVFPNYFQHKVEPFGLVDDEKIGKRRIFVAWLIDPTRPRISTSYVTPQQAYWFVETLDDCASFGRVFPKECIENIVSFMGTFMSAEEARVYRSNLMEERSMGNDAFEGVYRKITYCEH